MVPAREKKLSGGGDQLSSVQGVPIEGFSFTVGGGGGGVGGWVVYTKWEAFSSTFSDRRSFMAAALSMMVCCRIRRRGRGAGGRGRLMLQRTRDLSGCGKIGD